MGTGSSAKTLKTGRMRTGVLNGYNIGVVVCHNGEFRKQSNGQWEMFSRGGGAGGILTEAGRDEWTVTVMYRNTFTDKET